MNGIIETMEVIQQRFSNFEIFSNMLRGYALDLQQLDHGPFTGILQQIQCGHVFINRVTTSRRFEVFGNPPQDLRTFGVPTKRCLPFTWRHKYSTGNSIQIYNPGTELEMITDLFFEAIDISIRQEDFNVLLHGWNLPELDEIINQREMVSCHPVRFKQLQSMLHSVCATLDANPNLLELNPVLQNTIKHQVPSLLAQALLSSEDIPTISLPEKRRRALKEALKYIRKTPLKFVNYYKFHQETGINQRTLQRAFLDQYDISPKSYAKTHQLSNVYKALVRSNPEDINVHDVANRFGFKHMSQFAKDYHSHFGELPSETLNIQLEN
ncbi:MAG: helix-turn-helix domain-containing protein [Arenicellales bacterium]